MLFFLAQILPRSFSKRIVILMIFLASIYDSQSVPFCPCALQSNWLELSSYLLDWRRLEAPGIDCSCHAVASTVARVVFTDWRCGVAWAISNDSDWDSVQASCIGEECSGLSP